MRDSEDAVSFYNPGRLLNTLFAIHPNFDSKTSGEKGSTFSFHIRLVHSSRRGHNQCRQLEPDEEMMKDQYKAAVAYIDAARQFKVKTGLGAIKATEVLVMAFVNAWLELERDERRLNLKSDVHGADGIVVRNGFEVEGRSKVEIKTLQGSGSFQFGRHFLPHGTEVAGTVLNQGLCELDDHLMVICAILDGSTIKTVYVAHGESVMRRLAELLALDTQRPSFRVTRQKGGGDNPLLHARSADSGRGCLDALSGEEFPYWRREVDNSAWVKKIDSRADRELWDAVFGVLQ